MNILGLQCDLHDASVEIVPPFVLWIRETQLCNHISILGLVMMHSNYALVAKSYVCSAFCRAWRVPLKFPIFLLAFFIVS